MRKKSASAISIIGGSDGPTSVFLAGKHKRTIKQRIKGCVQLYKKKRIEKTITAAPHTMDEVVRYLIQCYGFIEVDKSSGKYQNAYRWMRASFIQQYRPDLLGEYCEAPILKDHSEASVKHFIAYTDARQRLAEAVPKSDFEIDLRVLALRNDTIEAEFSFEKTFDYIGGSASGNKKEMKQFYKIYRDIYRFFGVSQADIDGRTERYKKLVVSQLSK